MEKEVKNILENSIKDVVVQSVKDIDIQGIFNEQIESVVQSVARDMFSSYGDFSKDLKEKLKKDIQFNIEAIKVPQFGAIATEIVTSNLKNIEIEQREKLEKDIKKQIDEFLGAKKEPVESEKLIELFYANLYEEYKSDDCSCGAVPENLSDFLEYFEYNSNTTPEFELLERSSDYRWDTTGCISHLNMNYEDSTNKDKYGISMHIYRVDNDMDDGAISRNRYQKQSQNLYKILSIEINGQYLTRDGVILYDNLNNDLERLLVAVYQSDTLLDLTKLSHIDLCEE